MPSWRTSTPTRPACGSCAVGPGSRPPSRLSPTTNQKRRDHTGLVLGGIAVAIAESREAILTPAPITGNDLLHLVEQALAAHPPCSRLLLLLDEAGHLLEQPNALSVL